MHAQSLPIDARSTEQLAARGLRYGLVDPADRDAFAGWEEADYRGFHDRRPEADWIDEHVRSVGDRRTTAVWDPDGTEPDIPVATVASWIGELSVPGGATLDSWAISSVTVAPTHRRRGVARALLEGELRTAVAAGVPMASLTVSEATIYGRYGFGPATETADLTIDARRAGWVGPEASGRLGFVSLETLLETGRAVFERARLRSPGEFDMDDRLWGRIVGLIGDRDKHSASLRAVRYDDESGVPQGFVIYRLVEDSDDFTKHTVNIRYLSAATDEAYAAVWRFVLELDLVAKVAHNSASVDEPVLWMLRDPRAAAVVAHDHHWLRILDVVAALGARHYSAPASLTIRVEDPLEFADGTFRLEAASDGVTIVTETDAAPDLSMSVATLSSLYLGGVSAATLAKAGLVRVQREGAVSAFDGAFRSADTPWLSYWY